MCRTFILLHSRIVCDRGPIAEKKDKFCYVGMEEKFRSSGVQNVETRGIASLQKFRSSGV
jgi:hypothetical protein